jgi:hypothetical protein
MQNPPPITDNRARLWIAAILLMTLCVIATAWFPLFSITALPSENYNEGWNAYRQWMTVEGQPLYGSHSVLWTTNYPFLSFHIIGLLGAAKQNMVQTGRIVCFLSLIVTSVLMGGIVREVTSSRAGGLYAGLSLFAWLAAFYAAGRADNDPELLSLAFTSLGLFAYFKAHGRFFWIALAAIAFAVSLFTKHDLIAFPLSIGTHLLITRDWRNLAVFCFTGAIAALLLLALSIHLDGNYFFAELLQPRGYDWQNLAKETLHYLLHFLVPLLIGVSVLVSDRNIPYRGFLFILLIFTNVIAVYFSGGDGVASNVFYPPLIADLLACVIGICQLQRRASARSFRRALTIATLFAALMVPAQVQKDIAAALLLPATTQAAQQAIARLQATNGPAICEDLLLCYDAGKPMDYDPYYVKDQIMIGRLQERGILGALTSHHYAAIQIDGFLNGNLLPRRNVGRFTNPFLTTLYSQYQPVFVSHRYIVFVPRPYGPGANLSGITKARAAGG